MASDNVGLPSRDALLAENEQLRRQLAEARRLLAQSGSQTPGASDARGDALAGSRQDAARARAETRRVRAAASNAAVAHEQAMARRQAELTSSEALAAALLASEGYLRLILESATDFAIITVDPDGNITGWNSGARNILGWEEAEILGRHSEILWTPEDRASGALWTELRTALEKGRSADERWHLRRDRSRFWAMGEMMPMYDPDDTLVGYLKILRDRTAQREADAALRVSEERLQLAMSAGLVGFWDWDMPNDLVHANAQFAQLYGVGPERALAGVPVAEYVANIHPDDRDLVRENIGQAVATGGEFEEEYRLLQPDGSVRWVLARGRCFLDEHGQPARFPGVSLDITRRKRAELALLESEERLALAVQAAGIGIWDAGPELQNLLWDDQVRVLFGLEPGADITAEQNLGAIHPEDRPAVQRAIAAAYDPAGPGEYDAEFRTIGISDGVERWLTAKGRVRFRHGTPVRFLGAVREITAEKRAEAALRDLNATLEQRVAERTAELAQTQEALIQAQKMEAVGQLTGGLAHDFNNLLTGISGSLELLGARIAQGRIRDIDRYISTAQDAARRAASLTHRLLAFSRRQTLDPKPTDVNRLVAGMEDLVRRTVGPEIAVEVAAADGLWSTLVDPSQLESALLNLCINARDAMPAGGRLTIETGNTWLDERTAREHGLPAGHYIMLSVSDNGTGMPPDVIARAFDPFFTTKPIGKGTGLGLSMIYGFARQSGGLARIDSETGRGTTVRLFLPRHDGVAEELEMPAALSEAPQAGQGETVLIVDDEPTVRMLLTEVLEDLGYTSIEAADGAASLAVLRSDRRIDLLVTDVGLPGGINGRQLADAARALRPGLNVLFITGFAENAVLGHDHLDPGMHILIKPFAMETLATRIKALITGGPKASPWMRGSEA